MAVGFGWSIIFMLGMIGSLFGMVAWQVRRIVKAEELRAATREHA